MTDLQRYLAEEIVEDHADGLVSRREALRRLGLLGARHKPAAATAAYRRMLTGRRQSDEPSVVTGFATGTPGANGVVFDKDGNLYVSDGGTAQGRVFRIGPGGGPATVLFRVPTMANSVGVGRQNQALQPPAAGAPPATQAIVANGLAFDTHGAVRIADTARGALWRVELGKGGDVLTATGCDSTFTADTLCLDAVRAASGSRRC